MPPTAPVISSEPRNDKHSHAMAEQLIERTKSLSVAPPVAFQLYMLTQGPDYSCEAIVDLVSLDLDLTAQLLRLCNSVIFRGRKVSSLREAVLRIGNGVIAEKALSLTVGRMMSQRKTAYCPDPNALWRHSVQTALACRYLTTYCEGTRWDPNLTFTAGLLHDIGKMVINSAPATDTAKLVSLVESQGLTWADAELEALGADHAEIGGLLLDRWHLPEEITRAVRFHHAPEFDHLGLANLIHVANACAKVNAGSKEWDDFESALHPYALQQLRLSLPRVKACWNDVMHDVEAIESFMWS
jgi:putative nucleotidyltransferase with HDIG domain